MSSLCVDLDLNIQETVIALPPPLQSGPHHFADYLPIRGLRIRFLRDCARVLVVSTHAHPRQLLDIPAIRIHFSTTCPFLIPLPLVLILNPGIIRRRGGITPTVSNLPGALYKRKSPSDLKAPLNPAYLVTPQTLMMIPHRLLGSIHPLIAPVALTSLVMAFMYPQTFRLHRHLNPRPMPKPQRALRKPLNVTPRRIYLLQELMGLLVHSPIVSFLSPFQVSFGPTKLSFSACSVQQRAGTAIHEHCLDHLKYAREWTRASFDSVNCRNHVHRANNIQR